MDVQYVDIEELKPEDLKLIKEKMEKIKKKMED